MSSNTLQAVLRCEGALDGLTNMSRDSELLAAAEEGLVSARIYFWDGPWVTLGRFQTPEEALVTETVVPWVKRPTGGMAVLHGHDVTVSIAAPLHALTPDHRSLKLVYRALVEPIVEALRSCGLPATLAEETGHAQHGKATPDCFAFRSANDVVEPLEGHKLCGVALRVTRKAALVQASIPYRPPLVPPDAVIQSATSHAVQTWDLTAFPEALARSLGAKHAFPSPFLP